MSELTDKLTAAIQNILEEHFKEITNRLDIIEMKIGMGDYSHLSKVANIAKTENFTVSEFLESIGVGREKNAR